MQSLVFIVKQTQLDRHTTMDNCASSAEQRRPGQVAVQTMIHKKGQASVMHRDSARSL